MASWANDPSDAHLRQVIDCKWKCSCELANEFRSNFERFMNTNDWVQPKTAKLLGVQTDVPVSLGHLLYCIENFHEDVRLRAVNSVILAFTDNLVDIKQSYQIPAEFVDIVHLVSLHLKMPESKAKMLVFSLSGNNNIEMFMQDEIIVFYCLPEDAQEFMGMLPGYKGEIKSEHQLTLIYRQLSKIIDYTLRFDFTMAAKASIASAEINALKASDIIHESPSLINQSPLVHPVQRLIPTKDVSHKSSTIENALNLLSLQRAGGKCCATNVTFLGCEMKHFYQKQLKTNL